MGDLKLIECVGGEGVLQELVAERRKFDLRQERNLLNATSSV
ncbi:MULTISPECIES: hypothetical protein [unclassified Bradyrhizobium]|nr:MULTISPECIES: hypothetical protein [unclassified Bradyrhizobium]